MDVAYGIKYVFLRYFNAAGAHISGEIGEDHRPETHLIPIVLEAALGKRNSVEIYGDDYETPDGSCIRDYIHVTDLAVAHILALKSLREGSGSKIYNLQRQGLFRKRSGADRKRSDRRKHKGNHSSEEGRRPCGPCRFIRKNPQRAKMGAQVRRFGRDNRYGMVMA